MPSWPPAVQDFKDYFTREFTYGDESDDVMDADITRAINEAGLVFNQALWISSTERNVAYLYVAAHFLALNIQGAGGLNGVQAGVQSKGGGTIETKAVGGVSVGFALPALVRESPILSQFMQTGFGQKYLALITPRLVGNIAIVSGGNEWPCGSFAGTISPLVVTTESLDAATFNVAYSEQLEAEGGVAPISWSITNGDLPAGLTLSAVGVISGTPISPGSFLFLVTATDADERTANMNLQIVVNP